MELVKTSVLAGFPHNVLPVVKRVLLELCRIFPRLTIVLTPEIREQILLKAIKTTRAELIKLVILEGIIKDNTRITLQHQEHVAALENEIASLRGCVTLLQMMLNDGTD